MPHFTNGCAVSPDGRWLWVVESYVPIVSRFDLETGAREEVTSLLGTVLDGIAFTADGGVLISCYRPDRIYHLDAAGHLEVVAQDPQGTLLGAPTNVCFVGPRLDRVVSREPRPLAPDADGPRAARRAAAPARRAGRSTRWRCGHEPPRARCARAPSRRRGSSRATTRSSRRCAPASPSCGPTTRCPSDAMLCEEFGVSRMTARNAVQRLTQEGLVYRVPGRGTFVAEPPVHRQAGSLLSFTEEMRRRGREPSSRVLARERPRAAPRRGRRGSSSSRPWRSSPCAACGWPTTSRWRSRRPSSRPILAPLLQRADLEHRSLHDTLVEGGHVPTMGRARLGAEAAGPEDAELLDVALGSPLLVEKRVIHDQDGNPLELCESRYAAERYGLDVQFDVELSR